MEVLAACFPSADAYLGKTVKITVGSDGQSALMARPAVAAALLSSASSVLAASDTVARHGADTAALSLEARLARPLAEDASTGAFAGTVMATTLLPIGSEGVVRDCDPGGTGVLDLVATAPWGAGARGEAAPPAMAAGEARALLHDAPAAGGSLSTDERDPTSVGLFYKNRTCVQREILQERRPAMSDVGAEGPESSESGDIDLRTVAAVEIRAGVPMTTLSTCARARASRWRTRPSLCRCGSPLANY